MPELPEVEVICRGLRPHVCGQKIIDVKSSGKQLRTQIPLKKMKQWLIGHSITEVRRRAKNLLLYTEEQALLIIHLGMTGNLGLFPVSDAILKHDHVRWSLDNGMELRYNDTRRFGAIHLLSPDEEVDKEQTVFATTGPEPFSDAFNATDLFQQTRNKKQAIKNFLMSNPVVSGVGNIYANETLFKVSISPLTPVNKLTLEDYQRIITSLRAILTHAIECGGSTISDFVNANRESGYFQVNFKVYGKNNTPCPSCGTTIEKIKIGGRASFFCPECQK